MLCNVCWDEVPTEHLCFCDCLMVPKSESNASDVNDNDSNRNNADDNKNAKPEHAFCKECLVQYTKAAHEEMPFAKSGLGLRCMVPKCENPIAWREIRAFIADDMSIEKLQERCEELSIIHSGIYLERCHKCNFTVGMDVPPEQELKFCCPKCNWAFSRKCDEEWKEEHNDLSCEQFAKQQKQQFQNRLSEAVVHKCHKCKFQFVKFDANVEPHNVMPVKNGIYWSRIVAKHLAHPLKVWMKALWNASEMNLRRQTMLYLSSMELKNSTENHNNYSLEFTGNIFKLICHLAFQVQLQNGAILEKYWNMNPVSGTDNKQFTLPDNVHLYPGRSFADAGMIVAGGGQPNVTVVAMKSVLSTKKCPDSAD
uniref:RING-type domain-containing protein n=1 Tax=Globodera pallida TaxID=36090 RepID=A0A183CBR5_GLOPA